MKFCPECGRKILDESLGCPLCGLKDNEVGQQFDQVSSGYEDMEQKESVQEEQPMRTSVSNTNSGANYSGDKNENYNGARNYGNKGGYDNQGQEEKSLPTIIKVILIVLIVISSGIGAIAGIIGGTTLMKSPYADYRKFGKTMLIVGVLMLTLGLLCLGTLGLLSLADLQ